MTVNHAYSQPGKYNVMLNVTDNNGSQSNLMKQISIENHPPTVEILNIEPFDYLSGTVIITGRASDPDGNETITKVTVYISKFVVVDNITAEGTTNWTCTWNTKKVQDGGWAISAQSEDDSGLLSDGDTEYVIIDNTPPVVIILCPLNAIYIGNKVIPFFIPLVFGDITLSASHIDYSPLPPIGGIERVEYYINGELICNKSKPGSLSTCMLNRTYSGVLTLEVKAYDYAKNNAFGYKPIIVKFF